MDAEGEVDRRRGGIIYIFIFYLLADFLRGRCNYWKKIDHIQQTFSKKFNSTGLYLRHGPVYFQHILVIFQESTTGLLSIRRYTLTAPASPCLTKITNTTPVSVGSHLYINPSVNYG